MSGRLHRVCLLGAVFAGLVVAPALASGTSAEKADDLAQLTVLLEAQQKKIEALEQQVAAAAQQDMDRARAAGMKQQIREVLSEQEFREDLMPSTLQAGYDNGFFIRSTDDKFKMTFNGMMQFRWTYTSIRDENRYLLPGFRRSDRAGFDLARVRFRMGGHAYTEDLTYLLEMDASAPGGYDFRVFYAWVNYRFVDEFQIKAGVFRTGATRADVASTARMQLVDYPMMNGVFGTGNGLGVRLWGKALDKRLEYYLDVVNSLNTPGTRTITTDENLYTLGHDNNPAIIFRTVYHALTGGCKNPPDDAINHFTTPCDMELHEEPALNFGFHYVFNEDWHDGTTRIPFPRKTFFRPGGFGLTSSDGLQIHQFGLDTGFKWMGFSATGEYVIRLLDVRNGDSPPFTPLYMLTGDGSTNAQHGAYVQCGYFLPIPGHENKFEVAARVGGVSAVSSGSEGAWEYAGGFNYYIDGHRVKLQTDVTYIDEAPFSGGTTYGIPNVNDNPLIWRVQLQVAF